MRRDADRPAQSREPSASCVGGTRDSAAGRGVAGPRTGPEAHPTTATKRIDMSAIARPRYRRMWREGATQDATSTNNVRSRPAAP
jgi:hypothetical protein